MWSSQLENNGVFSRIRCTESSQVEKNGTRHRMSHRYNPPRSYPPDLQSRLPRFPPLCSPLAAGMAHTTATFAAAPQARSPTHRSIQTPQPRSLQYPSFAALPTAASKLRSHVRHSTQTSQPCPPRHPKRRIPIRHDTPSAIGYNEEENLVHRRSPHGKNRNP